jgi:hypothetical protein
MPTLPLLTSAAFDPEATKTLASAFDSAWSVLQRSGSTLAYDENAIVTLERSLSASALVHVANSKFILHKGWATAGEW